MGWEAASISPLLNAFLERENPRLHEQCICCKIRVVEPMKEPSLEIIRDRA